MGRWVAFEYGEGGATESRERTVYPRWLQLAEVAGERTLCVIADCPLDGRTPFALARMTRLRVAGDPNASVVEATKPGAI
jgi:hypothetical protein